jgi:hypothetical protein
MKRKKSIVVHYQCVPSQEAKKALEEIFDDIFLRILKNKQKKCSENKEETLTITQYCL